MIKSYKIMQNIFHMLMMIALREPDNKKVKRKDTTQSPQTDTEFLKS